MPYGPTTGGNAGNNTGGNTGAGGGGGVTAIAVSGATEYPASSDRFEHTITTDEINGGGELYYYFTGVGAGQTAVLSFPEETGANAGLADIDTIYLANVMGTGSIRFASQAFGATTTQFQNELVELEGFGTLVARRILAGVWSVSAEGNPITDAVLHREDIWTGAVSGGTTVPLLSAGTYELEIMITSGFGNAFTAVPFVYRTDAIVGVNIASGIYTDTGGDTARFQVHHAVNATNTQIDLVAVSTVNPSWLTRVTKVG